MLDTLESPDLLEQGLVRTDEAVASSGVLVSKSWENSTLCLISKSPTSSFAKNSGGKVSEIRKRTRAETKRGGKSEPTLAVNTEVTNESEHSCAGQDQLSNESTNLPNHLSSSWSFRGWEKSIQERTLIS